MNAHLAAATLGLVTIIMFPQALASDYKETYRCTDGNEVMMLFLHHQSGRHQIQLDEGGWQPAEQSIDYDYDEVIFSNATWTFRDQAQSKGVLKNLDSGNAYRCSWVGS